MPNYELWLTDDVGRRLTQLRPVNFSASRVANAISGLSMRLPVAFDRDLLERDNIIQVWRDGSLFGLYFIRRWKISVSGNNMLIDVWGRGPNDILRRRPTLGYAGETEVTASAEPADDLMKRIVTNALADSLGTFPTPDFGTRALSGLSVQGDVGRGPEIDKGFAYKELLSSAGGGILTEIASIARAQGNEVFFSVEPSVVTGRRASFEFRTTTGQPGNDLTGTRLLFSQENNNIEDPSLEHDYEDEINYIYAAGQGQGDNREIQQAYDADRIRQSVWNRCEAAVDARQQDDPDKVLNKARQALNDGRGRVSFDAVPLSVPGSRFGVDWGYGDRVSVSFAGERFESVIRAVSLDVSPGVEKIGTRLEYDRAA